MYVCKYKLYLVSNLSSSRESLNVAARVWYLEARYSKRRCCRSIWICPVCVAYVHVRVYVGVH